ncbi:hypothetical protein BDA96_05G074500 [Sorghum bicolor]|uniref:Uncharacterized protein n=2 Tax=Sorghum bicolor TaxID=4558 RepID=A0A921QXY8_SORBI|nr:hypothetical protein BDA96_05G074500 [Sorghum bicolor]KXG27998.1 hypothetical protein SORBI_3005G073900 [Sorghum bicolor]
MEISTEISQHLKTLEVNCEVYDKRVCNVLTFLSKKLNICSWRGTMLCSSGYHLA